MMMMIDLWCRIGETSAGLWISWVAAMSVRVASVQSRPAHIVSVTPPPTPQQPQPTSSRPTSHLRTACRRRHHHHTSRQWTSPAACITIIITWRPALVPPPTRTRSISTMPRRQRQQRRRRTNSSSTQIDIICWVPPSRSAGHCSEVSVVTARRTAPVDARHWSGTTLAAVAGQQVRWDIKRTSAMVPRTLCSV